MLWHKSWLETRSRFVIGLVLVVCGAASVVLTYPRVVELLPLVPARDTGGEIGRRIREAADLARDYRGYVWSQWFAKHLSELWTLFAVLLGTGGLVSQVARGGALFTLSLPVSRNRLLVVRAATALAELLVLAFVPSVVLVALSPTVGESYSLGDALIHSACLFAAGTVFFSLAFLLSTVFADLWRPLLISLMLAVGLALVEQVVPALSRVSVLSVMSAQTYFQGRGLPWLGLAASAAASAAMLVAAGKNIARQDF
jgi:ABC-type transport system involved in multi-copper enzyme maturation permease subunit